MSHNHVLTYRISGYSLYIFTIYISNFFFCLLVTFHNFLFSSPFLSKFLTSNSVFCLSSPLFLSPCTKHPNHFSLSYLLPCIPHLYPIPLFIVLSVVFLLLLQNKTEWPDLGMAKILCCQNLPRSFIERGKFRKVKQQQLC